VEQIELLCGEADKVRSNEALPPVRKDFDIADMHHIRSITSASSENGFDPQDKFSRTKRFRHVIVGAQFEANHTIDLLTASRQHEDWYTSGRGLLPKSTADLEAIHIRKHHVENDKVRQLFLNQLQSRATGGCSLNFEASVTQVVADQPDDVGIIIHDQDAFHAGCPAP
jgi:hypothetical protein